MKTIKDIYGGYMTRNLAETILNSATNCTSILKLRRDELVHRDLHDKNIEPTCDALKFWEEVEKQYSEFLRSK